MFRTRNYMHLFTPDFEGDHISTPSLFYNRASTTLELKVWLPLLNARINDNIHFIPDVIGY